MMDSWVGRDRSLCACRTEGRDPVEGKRKSRCRFVAEGASLCRASCAILILGNPEFEKGQRGGC